MILRKPYALLIKHFKKIHFVLSLLMIYVAYESNHILSFFRKYISTGAFTRTSFSLSSRYINIYMFSAAIIIAIIALIIYILMRQKKKPTLIYLIIIGFYLGLVIFFFYIYNILGVIEISPISPRSVRVIRDIVTVIYYSQYALILVMGTRAVGFDIKKFNFGEDLAELEIDVSDNEEFELTVGIDPNKIGRRLRRGRREIKYFIIENKFVLTLISLIAITSLSIIFFLDKKVYNKLYTQSEPFKAGYFINMINSCNYTNINQRGVPIAPEGKAFVITEVLFHNKYFYPQQLSLDNINLVYGSSIYSPIITRYQSFVDLGIGYTNQTIEPDKTGAYIFVFEIDEGIDLNNLMFRYRESLKISSTRLEAKYKMIRLKCAITNEINKVKEANIGEELTFIPSPLGNSKLKIKDVKMEKSFNYESTHCVSGECYTQSNILTLQYTTVNKMLMKLSFDYTKDSNINLINVNRLEDVIQSYGFLRYNYGGKTYNAELINKTPGNYKGKDLYYQVSDNVKKATKVDLVIRIRDKEYIYKLK